MRSRMRSRFRLLALALVAACGTQNPALKSAPTALSITAHPPRLIVQITVDQLRADLVTRYADRYVEGGLRRFLTKGLCYDNAQYAHAITETAVGHATLFTGALPSDHGIIGNEWLDRAEKLPRMSVADERHKLLSLDPAPQPGASPYALRATTIGDELALASDGKALVFSVSLKDRAAVLPAGHAGKAFWYEDDSGQWVSSDYYYSTLPSWLVAYAREKPADRYQNMRWELLLPRDGYVHKNEDDRRFEKGYRQLGRTFPHPLAGETPEDFYKTLKRTPMGDELTLALVQQLLENEPLGRDEVTDLLAVSFSATDYVGHNFGPESLEAEDNLLRLDRTIAALFDSLLSVVSARDLLVVLSADHGVAEAPEYLQGYGIEAGRHDPASFVAAVNAGLEQRFGAGSAFVTGFVNPSLWLDEPAIAARGLALEQVERAAADIMLTLPGFAYAITKSDLLRGSLPSDPLHARVSASFDRERSGNIYLVPSTGWVLSSDGPDLTAMHGTPYRYDTAVPILFWGHNQLAGHVARAVDPRDIAPTLALLAKIKPPSASTGTPLSEALTLRHE